MTALDFHTIHDIRKLESLRYRAALVAR